VKAAHASAETKVAPAAEKTADKAAAKVDAKMPQGK
jgi:hypothetical protein